MDADRPCRCPRCGWLGTIHDSDQFTPQGTSDVLDVCPRCAPEIRVQVLGQAGLDALRREHKLLLKPSFKQQRYERDARREQIERFFEHIHQPLRP